MSNELPAGARPTAGQGMSAHKMIGTLNILFAGIMLLCGACSGFGMLMQVAMAPLSEGYQKTMQEALLAQQQQVHQRQVDALQEQEDTTTDADEKARLAAARQQLESRKPVEVPMADMMGMYRDPTLVGFLVTDAVTGLILNALMLTSGIGLLAARGWARKLALWVGGLKIARLMLVYGFAIAVVVPFFATKMGEMVEKMISQMPQRPGAPPPAQISQAAAMGYGISLSAGAVIMIIGGVIYPIIVIWVLTRPHVKAACGERLPAPPAQPT